MVFATWMLVLVPVVKVNASLWSSISKSLSGSNVYAASDLTYDDSNIQNMSILKHEEIAMATNEEPHYNIDGTTLLPNISIYKTLDPSQERIFTEGNDQISVYIVKKGDTLSEVAGMFEVSTSTIAWANNLDKSKALKEGQELVILPVSGVYHTVRKGETVKSIANKYGADAQNITAFNDIALGAGLVSGSVLIVPDGELSIPVVAKSNSNSKAKSIAKNRSISASYFIRPTRGVRTQGLHGHNGIDFGGRIGDAVNASADGVVIIARYGWDGGYGNYVVVKHPNGMQTLYGHLSHISIEQGQSVTQGQLIGQVGNTGQSTGPHLHYEVHGGVNPF